MADILTNRIQESALRSLIEDQCRAVVKDWQLNIMSLSYEVLIIRKVKWTTITHTVLIPQSLIYLEYKDATIALRPIIEEITRVLDVKQRLFAPAS